MFFFGVDDLDTASVEALLALQPMMKMNYGTALQCRILRVCRFETLSCLTQGKQTQSTLPLLERFFKIQLDGEGKRKVIESTVLAPVD